MLVQHRTLMIHCLCNVLFTGLQSGTNLDSLSALYREIPFKKTYIHTYKHDLSPFSMACWIPASRLRRSACLYIFTVWKKQTNVTEYTYVCQISSEKQTANSRIFRSLKLAHLAHSRLTWLTWLTWLTLGPLLARS